MIDDRAKSATFTVSPLVGMSEHSGDPRVTIEVRHGTETLCADMSPAVARVIAAQLLIVADAIDSAAADGGAGDSQRRD